MFVAYYNGLSESSKRSFELQGGTMSAEEIKAFLTPPAAQVAIELRRIDDLAKQLGRVVPDAREYRLLLLQALRMGNVAESNA